MAGTGVVALLRVRGRRSPLLERFGVLTAVWGVVELAFVAVRWPALGYRDLASATRLDRMLWMNAGLESGFVMVGIAIVGLGWRLERRLGLMGAGAAVVVQGLALLLLTFSLAARISR